MNVVEALFLGVTVVCGAYFLVLGISQLALSAVGWWAIEDYVRRRPLRDYDAVGRSPMTLPVTILVPAYNEGPIIVTAMRALLASQFRNLELVIVNDGSTDDTFARLVAGFDLIEADIVPRANLPCRPVTGVWVSSTDERVTVLDKANGGKADSLNAALRYARHPLVCAIDADTMLDAGALARLVWEFQASPDTVATGGIVRVLNGSTVQDGRIVDVRTSPSLIANVQILEYLRAFLGARIGWSKAGMLLIISGAFGLFRRDAIVEIGGYDSETVGEDAELVLRLHRHFREQNKPCRITFFPDPICWTAVPGDLAALVRQRDRWQRGMLELLRKHRDMIGNRRYGRIGLVLLPWFVLFEVVGPILELVGLITSIVGLATGLLPADVGLGYLGASLAFGFLMSFLAILMEERAFRRYPGWTCLRRLIVASFVENVGYRQLMNVVRARAFFTLRRKGHWGEMTRTGFEPVPVHATSVERPRQDSNLRRTV